MSAPLISDATLATIVRIIWSPEYCARLDPSDRDMIAGFLVEQKYSDALDYARGIDVADDPIQPLWIALEEANEEAARTHDEREAVGTREPAPRQKHDPSRRWACPTCTSVLAVDRIAEILAAQGARYVNVIRCLCGEVRP